MGGADARTREEREAEKDERCSRCKSAVEEYWNESTGGVAVAAEGDKDEKRRRRRRRNKEVGEEENVDADGDKGESGKWRRRLSKRLTGGRGGKTKERAEERTKEIPEEKTRERSEVKITEGIRRSDSRLGRMKQRAVGVTRTLRGEGAMVRA